MIGNDLKMFTDPLSVNTLCKKYNLDFFSGNKNIKIHRIASIFNATEDSLIFLYNKSSLNVLHNKKSFVCITNIKIAQILNETKSNITILINEKPKLILYKLLSQLVKQRQIEFYIDKTINISKSCNISKDVKINKYCYIGENVFIESETVLDPGVVIKDNVHIGKNCQIGSNTVISNTKILNDVKIGSNCNIGGSGFGIEKIDGKLFKVPHIGNVQIGDFCDIGSGCSIDRGTLDTTTLGDHVCIDNQCHIAHNVIIGDNTIIAGQSAISGSTIVGKNCVIGGQVGISDHLEIVDDVIILSKSGVTKDLKKACKYVGFPAQPSREFWRKKLNKNKK